MCGSVLLNFDAISKQSFPPRSEELTVIVVSVNVVRAIKQYARISIRQVVEVSTCNSECEGKIGDGV